VRRVDTVIVWLNYNSSRFLATALESLRGAIELDYDNHLVLVIDNGSSDGSREAIKRFIESSPRAREFCKFIGLDHNLGYDAAHNLAWRYVLAKYPEARFLVLLNNDAIPYPSSLRTLIEIASSVPRVCGVQGAIELGSTDLLDNLGMFMDELLTVYYFMRLKRFEDLPRKCFAVTYVSGAYSVYRIDALKRIALRGGDIFPTHFFAYHDDDLLGLLAYANGMRMVSVPTRGAKHFTSLTFRATGLGTYIAPRAYLARAAIHRTRYRPIALLHAFKTVLRYVARARGPYRGAALRSLVDGLLLAKSVERRYGVLIPRDRVKEIPLVPLRLAQALEAVASYGGVGSFVREYLEKVVAESYGFRCL